MSKNRFDLHSDRLSTTDENGKRVFIHPEDVKGKWRTRRSILYWVLIAIYMLAPWLYFQGKQLILFNISKREFVIFGHTYLSHDAPFLIFLFLIFTFLMAMLTSLYGRVWCGWACPQTVIIDKLYRKVEKLIEGSARKRMALEKSGWNFNKVSKRLLKLAVFFIISLHIAHSAVGYFVGTRELLHISMSSPSDHWGLFTITWGLAIFLLWNFGYFREQFCLIACPYGRIQSVAMDSTTLTVSYDPKRGEPRRGSESLEAETGTKSDATTGDCINCYHCVKVCPTGIDIRRGSQLECIACTNCIDACDTIMTKLGKPKGLIRYESEDGLQGKSKKSNTRSYIYLLILIGLIIAFTGSLSMKKEVDVTILRGNKDPYQVIQAGLILNHFKLRLAIEDKIKRRISVRVKGNIKDIKLVVTGNRRDLKEGINNINLFVKFNKQLLRAGQGKITLEIINNYDQKILSTKELTVVGPIE